MRWQFLTLLSSTLLGGCGLSLKPVAPATPEQLRRDFKLEEDTIYSPDETFKNQPESWLGRVGVVRKAGADCTTGGRLRWLPAYVRNDPATPVNTGEDPRLNYAVDAKVTDPEIQAQSLITQSSTANISALSAVAANLAVDTAAEVILTSFATQRISPGARFETAYAAYKTAHQADIINDNTVCYAFVVTGYAHKTLVTKLHTKADASAKGGTSGVNAAGTYMANSTGYTLAHLFALSPTVIKDQTGTPVDARATRTMLRGDIAKIQDLIGRGEVER